MKFDVDNKNRCRLVCVKFYLNRCRFAVAVAKCLEGSLFGNTVYCYRCSSVCLHVCSMFTLLALTFLGGGISPLSFRPLSRRFPPFRPSWK